METNNNFLLIKPKMMEKTIEKTADCIIMLLDICEELSVDDIQEILKQHGKIVFLSLGWLARDQKIKFIKMPDNITAVCLNDRHLWHTLKYKIVESIMN